MPPAQDVINCGCSKKKKVRNKGSWANSCFDEFQRPASWLGGNAKPQVMWVMDMG